MSFPVVDRYSQMIRSIVGGPFYESLGVVIPLRSGNTPLRLETGEVQTEFGVYINDSFSGTALSNLDGSVTFERKLPSGEVIISCKSRGTGRDYIAYVTVREWANWLAAYSSSLEDIDSDINQVRSNMSIQTAEASALLDIYGEPINFYQDLNQSVESYRDQVYYLRSAYRNFGGTYKGLDETVSAITQIDPLSYSRKYWGPNWVPDQSMLVNSNFTERSASLTNSTGNITGVSLLQVEPDVLSVPSTPHELEYSYSTNKLTWIPDGSSGIPVYASEGSLFLPGPKAYSVVSVLGRSTTILITNNVNDQLFINVDSRGILQINLPSGSPTVATVSGLINSALASDLRYGAGYNTTSSVYNSKLKLEAIESVQLCPGDYNSAGELFGVNPGNLVFDSVSGIPGVSLLEVTESAVNHIDRISTGYIESDYFSSLSDYAFRWKSSNAASYGGDFHINESGYYSLYDSLGHKLKVYIDIGLLNPISYSESIDLGYNRFIKNEVRSQGLWIVVDKANLPTVDQTDTISVYDDVVDGYVEIPDYWFVQGSTGSSTSVFYPSDINNDREYQDIPCESFKYRFTDPSLTSVSFIGHVKSFPLVEGTPRGSSSSLSIPGGLYDYEGYDLRFSTWCLSLNTGAISATLKVSFDGGINWLSSSSVSLTQDLGGLGVEDYTYVEFLTPVSSLIKYLDSLDWEDSGVLVSVEIIKASGDIDILIDSPNIQVKYISSGYLGNATVPRNLHRQYMEDLSYVWSKDPLTLNEKKYLGLPHSIVDKTSPYAGVTITQVSNDTPVGNGTLEYDYTPAGSVKKLRWSPYNTPFGTGVGYVSIPSDGTYTLNASDGSFIVVECIYEILPVDSKSKSINVSDETTYRGQTRNISPCYTSLDIHDVSEYDLSGNCKNLVGVIGEDDFSLCGLVNCEISSRDPFKYSFVYPEFQSPVIDESLILTLNGLNRVATLVYYSNQDQTEATLYADGIPVPNNLWSFSEPNEISIPDSNFSSGDLSLTSVFTIDYPLIYQVTSNVLELNKFNPTEWLNYAWWADYSMFTRYESTQGSYATESQLFFNVETGRATLVNRSDANKSTSKLMLQQAQIQREIPKSYWRFVDDLTVEVDLNYYVSGQYFLEHNEQRVYEQDKLTTMFEYRSGATPNDCISASWVEINKNEAINIYQSTPYPYHQLRLSVSGIRDLSDFRVRSMVIKGLNLRGLGADIPGLTPAWLGSLTT